MYVELYCYLQNQPHHHCHLNRCFKFLCLAWNTTEVPDDTGTRTHHYYNNLNNIIIRHKNPFSLSLPYYYQALAATMIITTIIMIIAHYDYYTTVFNINLRWCFYHYFQAPVPTPAMTTGTASREWWGFLCSTIKYKREFIFRSLSLSSFEKFLWEISLRSSQWERNLNLEP